MQPPEIREHWSTHRSSRGSARPLVIVLHHTAGTNSLSWLTKNPQGVSTHVLITRAGLIYRMVPDTFAAHTVGRSNLGRYTTAAGDAGNANQIALNIELENTGKQDYPVAQRDAAAWQCADWWNRWGDLPILGHKHIDAGGKTDPHGLDLREFVRRVWAWYER